jgi:hypothetical protein
MSVFSSCDGEILKIKTDCTGDGIVAAVSVAGFVANVPLTGFALDLSTNHQFLHSLDEFIYVFAFGDRVGELTLSGITFTGKKCPNTTSAAPGDLYSYYLQNRVSKTLKPTKITVAGGQTTLLGFLTGMRMEIPSPALPIMQWVLRYHVIIDSRAPGNNWKPPTGGTGY